jgi:DNA-binding transcriptional ArsR family regulator
MDILSALADPTRRDIIDLLHQRPLSAGEVAAQFSVSRPAISRHLRVLREAGLVTVEQTGRERIYRFDPTPLREIDAWLNQYRDLWTSRFDALETEVHRTRRERERREQAATNESSSTRKASA